MDQTGAPRPDRLSNLKQYTKLARPIIVGRAEFKPSRSLETLPRSDKEKCPPCRAIIAQRKAPAPTTNATGITVIPTTTTRCTGPAAQAARLAWTRPSAKDSGLRIHFLPRETPAAVPTPLGRPAINRWAIDTGPRLDLTHRVVLREIARYADDAPKTITVNGLLVHLEAGECCPTQETLAEGLDATDRTIRNSVRNLRGLGLLSTRPMPGADGKRLIYRLAGVDADWQPAPKNERESRPIIAAYRILAEGQVQSLEEAHRRIAYLESLLNDRYGHPAAPATGGDGTQPNPTGPAPENGAADELSNRNYIPVQQPNPTGPAPETVADGLNFPTGTTFRFTNRRRRTTSRRPSATTGPY